MYSDRNMDDAWQPHRVPTADVELACHTRGEGPPVVFINGGPGDDHRYLRPVAEPLVDRFRCILYDQRGCGESRLDRLDGETLDVGRFIDDVDAVRRHFGHERVQLVGHSWGALLALFYAAHHPDAVAGQVLVGMGPLDEAMGAVAAANLRQPLSLAERAALEDLRARRRAAIAAGDLDTHAELHIRQLAEFASRSWFYDPGVVAPFVEAFRTLYQYNPHITPVLWPTAQRQAIADKIDGLPVPTLVVYGYQDFEPITQAYLLRERMPHVEVCLINECGHVPWLEQPAAFYAALEGFLSHTHAPPSTTITAAKTA